MKIGRIVTEMKKIDTVDFVEKTSNSDRIDSITPTLIVGKELAIKLYGRSKIKVLDKSITPNVSWTYSKMEKRNEFEHDIEKFNNMVVDKLKKDVKYTFFNIFYEPLSRTKKLISFVLNPDKKVFYFTDKHIYFYYKNNVFGLSIDQLKYIGISIEKIKQLIERGINNIMFDDDQFISYRMRKRMGNSSIVIPYLYFLENK